MLVINCDSLTPAVNAASAAVDVSIIVSVYGAPEFRSYQQKPRICGRLGSCANMSVIHGPLVDPAEPGASVQPTSPINIGLAVRAMMLAYVVAKTVEKLLPPGVVL